MACLAKSFRLLSLSNSSKQVRRPQITAKRSTFCGTRNLVAPTIPKVIHTPVTVECAKGGTQKGGKLKTRKAAAKRFKVTGSGLVRRRCQNKQHLNEKKKRSKLRELSKKRVASNSDVNNVRKCLPYKKIRKT